MRSDATGFGSVLLLSAVILLHGCAPNEHLRYVDAGSSLDRGVAVKRAPGGDLVVTGATRSVPDSPENGLVLGLTPELELTARHVLERDGAHFVWDVSPGLDTDVYVGFTEFPGSDRAECTLEKYDGDWVSAWSARIDSFVAQRCWSVQSVQEIHFVVGEAGDGTDESLDCLIGAVDDAGSILWTNTYGGADGDRCFGIVPATDGGLLAAGQTYSDSRGQRDAFVVKVDANGSPEWTRTWGESGDDVAHDISPTSDGGFLVTGYSDSFGTVDTAPFVIRLDERGDEMWTRTVDWECHTRALSGVQVADGGYMLTGFTRCPAPAPPSMAVVKLSSDGRVEWTQNVDVADGGGTIGYALVAHPDDGAFVTGHTTDESGSPADVFVLRIRGRAVLSPRD